VESEEYATAARLRDEGAVGLPGWWVADNKEDPKGHLLRITTGFGRYVGYAYTPHDLAQAEVGLHTTHFCQLWCILLSVLPHYAHHILINAPQVI